MDFRALHVPGDPLVMPNPWDAGSAVLLQALGAKALATTSAGAAYGLGHCDGALSIDDILDNARAIMAAVDVPVSADLENGRGDTPEAAADAIISAAQAGLAGGSIEDYNDDPAIGIYDFDLTLRRVEAAIEAARAHDFVLTARAEGLLRRTQSLSDVADRIRAFAKAGADVVFAPALRNLDEVQTIMDAANGTPVSVLIGGNSSELTVQSLGNLGVARISVGSGLARAAYGTTIAIMQQALAEGRFVYPDTTASFAEIEGLLKR